MIMYVFMQDLVHPDAYQQTLYGLIDMYSGK
jgi:hypothetical protein